MATTPFGIVIELMGTQIALNPTTALADLKTKGIELELPRGMEVPLGNIAGGLQSFIQACATAFGAGTITFPSAADFPEPIHTAFNITNSVSITITDLYLKIPGPGTDPTKQATAPTSYRLGAYFNIDGADLFTNKLRLKGFSMRIVSADQVKPA